MGMRQIAQGITGSPVFAEFDDNPAYQLLKHLLPVFPT
jgi:hypothetical protein